jgi:broad specificity phosphatase PhoE
MADAASPRIILARHGETEMNRLLRCQGWLDDPLNDRGWEQARVLAEKMAETRVHHVVASSLKRAHMTASIVAAQHGLTPEPRLELRELYHGRLEGIPFAEIDKHVPGLMALWRTRPHEVVMPEGETVADLQARAWPAFEQAASQHLAAVERGEAGALILVSHAITMGTILTKLAGQPLAHVRDYRVFPCGYWELTHDGDTWRIGRGEGRIED